MKKLISVILALALFVPAVACADLPDISGLSFSELRKLRNACQRAMWECDEWKVVSVPAGVYKIGTDIPVNKWKIETPSYGIVYITYGTKLNAPETDIDYSGIVWEGRLTLNFDYNDTPHELIMNLEYGYYISFSGEVHFYPYDGRPKFDFN